MNRVAWLVGVVLLAMALFGAGFAGTDDGFPNARQESFGNLPVRMWGTGFFVDHDRHVLTAHHVVAKCARIAVVGPAGRAEAALVASSDRDDLSLLRAPGLSGEPIPIVAGASARGGAFVTVLSYPSTAAVHEQARLNPVPMR